MVFLSTIDGEQWTMVCRLWSMVKRYKKRSEPIGSLLAGAVLSLPTA
jgi:hypothetical protein